MAVRRKKRQNALLPGILLIPLKINGLWQQAQAGLVDREVAGFVIAAGGSRGFQARPRLPPAASINFAILLSSAKQRNLH